MWKKKLCLGVSKGYGLPELNQVEMFHEIGFDGFFSEWSDGDNDVSVSAFRKEADRLGMIYQSVHAPFGGCDKLWKPCAETGLFMNKLISCLRDCAENDVPIMVAHAFIGFDDHTPTEAGLENFGKLVYEAERLGVSIAFENTEGEEYLAALIERYGDSPAVGFCWDTGHELCYNHGKDMPGIYGKKLLCTHLNDNLGIHDYDGRITWLDDLHLLPFDGIADWEDIAARLTRAEFDGPLTFELNRQSKPGRHDNDKYQKMTPEEYITEAFARACKTAALVERLSGV